MTIRKILIYLAVPITLIIFIIFFSDFEPWMYHNDSEPYEIVHVTSMRSWYFDPSSLEVVTDKEEGIALINVWVKVEYKDEMWAGTDFLLWHLDINEKRYKVSDSIAHNSKGEVVEY